MSGESPGDAPRTGEITDRILVLFTEVYAASEFDRQPLPCDIYTQEGVVRAMKGQRVPVERLANSWTWVDKTFARLRGQAPVNAPVAAPEEPPPAIAPRVATHPSQSARTPAAHGETQGEEWREESADQLERRSDQVAFEPFAEVRAGFKRNLHQCKELFQKGFLGRKIILTSKNNKAISESLVSYLDELLTQPFHAADYIELVNAVRQPENYTTYAHPSGVTFYAMAIMRKLMMLKEDFLEKRNIGRWLPIKTRKNPRTAGALPFSMQLSRYFDSQKAGILLKYKEREREDLLEGMNDLMHEYAALDMARDWPSMRVDYSRPNRLLVGMAALNCDIAKLILPNEVINKPDSLDPVEMQMMQTHPLLGIFLLKEVGFDSPRVLAYILGHHRLLPAGYPPLRNNIFFESRIIGIADMYDAMRSPKFYKGALTHEAAIVELEKIHQAGAFDAPLWIAARHTFREFNHDLVATRNRLSIAPA